jgi:hypothetical protein
MITTTTDTFIGNETIIESPSLNLEPETSGTRAPISEEEARHFIGKLRTIGQERPSIRALANHWGWHRSRVERLLSRIDAETRVKTPTVVPEPIARPIAMPGPSGDDSWVEESIEDGTALVHEQPFTAVYFNTAGQVVIRQKGDAYEDDPVVLIAPEYLGRFIARLIECRDKGV